MGIYLDHAATTPLSATARDAMTPWLADGLAANPSSVHRSGQRARAAVEAARERIATAVGAAPAEIVLCSGATEADNLAVTGSLDAAEPGAPLVVSEGEHAAVLAVAERELRRGRPVAYLPIGETGAPTPAGLEATLVRLERPAALVAVMHTNNETGVVADVPGLAEVAHAHGTALLCDAVQAFGFDELSVGTLGADLVALSSHKIGGPQGVGALWIRDGHRLEPQALGGAQERGRRAGTHAVAAIVGFGAAAEEAVDGVVERATRTALLRDRLEAGVTRLDGVHRNGRGPRGPKHANLRVDRVDGESLLIALDAAGVEVSAGSACAAGSVEPSHVLMAMGLGREAAQASVRFSVAPAMQRETIDLAAERFRDVVERLRAV